MVIIVRDLCEVRCLCHKSRGCLDSNGHLQIHHRPLFQLDSNKEIAYLFHIYTCESCKIAWVLNKSLTQRAMLNSPSRMSLSFTSLHCVLGPDSQLSECFFKVIFQICW